jgi:hypothetical protein
VALPVTGDIGLDRAGKFVPGLFQTLRNIRQDDVGMSLPIRLNNTEEHRFVSLAKELPAARAKPGGGRVRVRRWDAA